MRSHKNAYGLAVIILVVAIALSAHGCGRAWNERAVGRLRQQMINERFDEIYEASSNNIKSTTSREVFVREMRNAVDYMKSIDGSLTLHELPEARIDHDYPYGMLSFREIRGKEMRLTVQIHWNTGFRFCGLDYGGDDPVSWVQVVRGCD